MAVVSVAYPNRRRRVKWNGTESRRLSVSEREAVWSRVLTAAPASPRVSVPFGLMHRVPSQWPV